MKVSSQLVQNQTLRGTISDTELLAALRQTFEIPESASFYFYVQGRAGEEFSIDEDEPLRFTVSWTIAQPSGAERVVPMRVVVPTTAPTGESKAKTPE